MRNIQDINENTKNGFEDVVNLLTVEPSDDNKSNKTKSSHYHKRNAIADISVYGLMNDKTSTQITQSANSKGKNEEGKLYLQWDINQAPRSHEPVVVHMALSYDGTESMLSKTLTTYDKAVYTAISNLFFYWKSTNSNKPLYITPHEIYRRMNGKQNRDDGAKPSPAQIKKIKSSVEKMRHIDFCLDVTAELKKHYVTLNDDRLAEGYIRDYLLNCSKVSFKTERGHKVTGYRINAEPILYTYQAAKNHILFLPFELLNTSSVVRDAENATEFKMYLLQQILLMKNGVRNNHKILLSTIYKATGMQTPEERVENRDFASESARNSKIRKIKKADRDRIEKFLDFWKEKKWIKGYLKIGKNDDVVKGNGIVFGYKILV